MCANRAGGSLRDPKHRSSRAGSRPETPGAIWANQFDQSAKPGAPHYGTPVRRTGSRPGGPCGLPLPRVPQTQHGTGGTYCRVALYLKERSPAVRCVLADPHAGASTLGNAARKTEGRGKLRSPRESATAAITVPTMEGARWMTRVRIDDQEAALAHDLPTCIWREGCSSEDPWASMWAAGRRRPPAVSAWPHDRGRACDSGRPLNRLPPLQTTIGWPPRAQPAPRGALMERGNLMESNGPARHLSGVAERYPTGGELPADWNQGKLMARQRPSWRRERRLCCGQTGPDQGPAPAAGALGPLRGVLHPQAPACGEVISRDGYLLAGARVRQGVAHLPGA